MIPAIAAAPSNRAAMRPKPCYVASAMTTSAAPAWEYAALTRMLADERLPAMIVDLDVFEANVRRLVAIARAHGLRVADRVYGHHQTGAVDERYVLQVVGALPAGVSELYCHPGAATGDDDELAAITSPRVRAACDAAGIERRHYDSSRGLMGWPNENSTQFPSGSSTTQK